MPDALVVFVIPLLLLAMFAVVAILSISVVRGLTTSSFRSGMRLLLVQCTALLGAGVGFFAGWLAHAYVPAVGAGMALWAAMLAGSALGGVAGGLFGLLATRRPRGARTAAGTAARRTAAVAYDDRSGNRVEDPPMSKVTIETLEARTAVGVRGQTRMATIGDDIGRLAAQVAGAAGARAAGPVCARYHSWGDTPDGPGGEIELLVPVAEPFAAGDVQPSGLPACRAAVLWHEGPYEGLHAAWTAIREWVEAEGLEASAPPWEEYVSDCTVTPPEELRTRIVWPIR